MLEDDDEATREELQSDILTSDLYRRIERGIGRACTTFSEGGEEGRSWFGKVEWSAPGESWPTFNDKLMEPFLQLDFETLDEVPEHCKDLSLVVVFVYPGPFEWTRKNGDGWCLRAYTKGTELVPLACPKTEFELKANRLTAKAIRDYPVGALAEPEIQENQDLVDDLEEQEAFRNDLYDDTDEWFSYRELYPNSQDIKIGGWPTWMHLGNDWPGEPSEPKFVFQVPNLKELGWEHGDLCFTYFARGVADPSVWVLDFQVHRPVPAGLLPVNLYHVSLVGADPRPPVAEWEEEEEEQELASAKFLLTLPCGCGNLSYSVTVYEDSVGQSYYQTSDGDGISEGSFDCPLPDNLYDSGPNLCKECGRYWRITYEKPGGQKMKVSLQPAFAGLMAGMGEARELVAQGQAEEAFSLWDKFREKRLNPPKGSPELAEFSAVGVLCGVAAGRRRLALEMAKSLPASDRDQGLIDILTGLERTPSPPLQDALAHQPRLEALLKSFWESEPSVGSQSGGEPHELAWRARVADGTQSLDVTVLGEVDDKVTLTGMEVLPPTLSHALTSLAFEDAAGAKAKGFFLAARTCLEFDLQEHALVLLRNAKRYFPDSEMVGAQLSKLEEAGVKESLLTESLRKQCESL